MILYYTSLSLCFFPYKKPVVDKAGFFLLTRLRHLCHSSRIKILLAIDNRSESVSWGDLLLGGALGPNKRSSYPWQITNGSGIHKILVYSRQYRLHVHTFTQFQYRLPLRVTLEICLASNAFLRGKTRYLNDVLLLLTLMSEPCS